MSSTVDDLNTCFFGQSSFCNPAIVQAASCIRINPDAPLAALSALGCGIQTGAGAVYNVVQPHKNMVRHLVIFGVGAVGCAAIMMAKFLGKQPGCNLKAIIAVDIVADRLDLAMSIGATHVVNSAAGTDLQTALQAIIGQGGVDAAIDCTANISAIEGMVKCVGAGGMAVTVGGPPPGRTAKVDVFDLLINAKTYRGCHQGNSEPRKVPPTQLYTHALFIQTRLTPL
jgi:aryl-alcohol dehydrogenase